MGLSSGFKGIDAMTKGMAPGDMIVIYGDTSHGKSQLTQNIVYNVAKAGVAVLFCGLEMIPAQNTNRFRELCSSEDELVGLPILYPDVESMNVDSIEKVTKEAVQGEGVGLIVIDQLQNLSRSVDNLVSEISQITHRIKRSAVINQVPVILVSHINRGGAGDRIPGLHDLKGSGSIEQDADIAIAVWRDMEIEQSQRELHVQLRKNRNRGMSFEFTKLAIDGVKLQERSTIDISRLASIFPGARSV